MKESSYTIQLITHLSMIKNISHKKKQEILCTGSEEAKKSIRNVSKS